MATPWKTFTSFLARKRIVWKNALGCALAWKIGELTGSKHPYLAPLAVILCLQVTIDKTIQHALQRFIGTIIGVLLTASVADLLGVHAWSIGLLILVGTGVAKWMKLGEQVIHQVALSVVLVLVFENKSPQYGFDRVVETVIGAVVAVLLNILVFPPNFTSEALQSIAQLVEQEAICFAKTARWVEQGCPVQAGESLHQDSKQLLKKLHQAEKDFNLAEKSLKYNPLVQKNKKQFARHQQQLLQLQKGYVHFSGMLRTLTDWSASGLMTREDQFRWAGELETFARDFKAWDQALHATDGSPAGIPPQPSGLTAEPGAEKEKYALALSNDAMQLKQDLQRGNS